jgi:selenocysteine lyase/cysteine desulfurase
VGLGTAVDYALSLGMPAIAARVDWLAQTLRRRLARLPGVQLHDLGERQCGLVSFTVAGRTAEEVKAALAERQINVSVSERAATRLDMDRRGLDEVVRASVHYYNSESEVEHLCEAVAEPPMAAA